MIGLATTRRRPIRCRLRVRSSQRPASLQANRWTWVLAALKRSGATVVSARPPAKSRCRADADGPAPRRHPLGEGVLIRRERHFHRLSGYLLG